MDLLTRPLKIGLMIVLLWCFSNEAYAIRKATPANNNSLRKEQSALLGSYIGLTLSGFFTPFPFSFGVDVAAYGNEIYLRHIPPQFSPPLRADFYTSATACTKPIRNTGYKSNMSGLFGFRLTPLDDQPFADILGPRGSVDAYHPHSAVRVEAINPYLRSKNGPLFFPEGHHNIQWRANTRVNPTFDIAVPAALIAASGYTKFKILSKFKAEKISKNAKNAALALLPMVKTAAKYGLYKGKTDIQSINDFVERTSYNGALNSSTQQLNVWDTTYPIFKAANSGNIPLTEQYISLEATDFGGAKLSRVLDYLESQFIVFDDCEHFNPQLQPGAPVIFPIGATSQIEWQINDQGPFLDQFSEDEDAFYQTDGNEGLLHYLSQFIEVKDTQPPIITVPGGFAYESAQTIEFEQISALLGRPRIVDLADPRPTFSRTELAQLQPDRRYEIYWSATDSSGNTSLPQQQLVTIKTPGTNTPPTANSVDPQHTITGNLLEIELRGTDTDEIDGRLDPLDFALVQLPQAGYIESPLYPHFIQDYRLSPVGDNEDLADNEVTRTSPLLHLADQFRLTSRTEHGTFLLNKICNADIAANNTDPFNNVIPVNFVYEPSYVHVDDEGYYYVRDHFWRCDVQLPQTLPGYRTGLSPIPRISKWDSQGKFIAMHELLPLVGKSYEPNTLHIEYWPDEKFSFDELGRIWITAKRNYVSFSQGRYVFDWTNYRYSNVRLFSLSSKFTTLYAHGEVTVDYDRREEGEEFVGIAVDRERKIYYDLRGWGFKPLNLANTAVLKEDGPQANTPASVDNPGVYKGYRLIPGCSPTGTNGCYGSGDALYNYSTRGVTDIEVDNDGYVYVLHPHLSRIYKYNPPTKTASGDWLPGTLVGWMGRCDGNFKNADNEDYNACDVNQTISRGFACTDLKCRVDSSSGALPGQFNNPGEITLDDNDILYVADSGNKRIQRFGRDGTFAGEATSTGGGFVLGNFKTPRNLSVNDTGFYILESDQDNADYFLHVFKSLPFSEMTASSAKLRYRSRYGFVGTDQFAFKVADGLAASDPVVVDIHISRDYNPPKNLQVECFATADLSQPSDCSLKEDGAIYLRLSSSDKDGFLNAENASNNNSGLGLDVHKFYIETPPDHGTLMMLEAFTSDNTVVYQYQPNQDFNGEDSFSFYVVDEQDDSAYTQRSADSPLVNLSVQPVPDPVTLKAPSEIEVPQGFNAFFAFNYEDVDLADHSDLISWDWDTSVAGELDNLNQYVVSGSGYFDNNGREIHPQIDFANGSGMFVASHKYLNATDGSLRLVMNNRDLIEDSFSYTSSFNIKIKVVQTTQLGLVNEIFTVTPGQIFDLQLAVNNRQPEGWAGLAAANATMAFELPEGLSLAQLDSKCTQTETLVHCALVSPDTALEIAQTVQLNFKAIVDLAVAREQLVFELEVSLNDDGPKINGADIALVLIQVPDGDEDGVADIFDAYPNNKLYSADSDQDGLADVWEEQYGLNKLIADDTTADIDQDGFSLLQEFKQQSFPLLAEEPAILSGTHFRSATNTTEDRFGQALAGGDLNQDGYADVIIGAPLGGTGDGAVYIAYGGPDQETQLQPILPTNNYTSFGRGLTVADFDGNGYPDIAVTAAYEVLIYMNNGQILQYPDYVLTDPEYYAFASFSTSGDLDRDGIEDLVLTTRDGSVGELFIYLSSAADFTKASINYYDEASYAGDSVTIADIDGDGLPDLLLGSGFKDQGSVHGFLGRDNPWSPGLALKPSFILPSPGNARFGYAITSRGDISGDGIDDLVVGAYSNNGAIYVYDSGDAYWETSTQNNLVSLTGPKYTVNGLSAGDQLGVSVAMVDLDGDGFADVVAGANRSDPIDTGHIQIFRGSAVGLSQDPEIEIGSDSFAMLGYFVKAVGDTNGDGFDDIAVAAPTIKTTDNPVSLNGYMTVFHQGYRPVASDQDPESDGVASLFDNCAETANTNQADLDQDTLGDVCDDDIDNDLHLNPEDNCPYAANAKQLDSDLDLEGDLCDSDDDNDGVADQDDAFPLLAKYTLDSDQDGLPDLYEAEHQLNANDPSDAKRDDDGDGLVNLDEFLQNTDPALDDLPPAITAPADLRLPATGFLTAATLGEAVAIDGKDGRVGVFASHTGPFRPGVHQIEWTATDASGNTATVQQQLEVVPTVELHSQWQNINEGNTITIEAVLNGDAPNYPVTLELAFAGSAEQDLDYQMPTHLISIDEGRRGSLTIDTLSDNLEDDGETIEIGIQNAVNANAKDSAVVLIITNAMARPTVDIQVEQSGQRLSSVSQTGGYVTIAVSTQLPQANATVAITAVSPKLQRLEHSETSSAGSEKVVGRFRFDPSNLPVGQQQFQFLVTYGDGAELSLQQNVHILAQTPDLAANMDTDGDGINDRDEGFSDSNFNGIHDHLETFSGPEDSFVLAATVAVKTVLLQTRAGHKLRLGNVAFAKGLGAEVGAQDIAEFGDRGQPAANVNDELYDYPLGIFDFEVFNLADTDTTTSVVIPLASPIPANAVYRKYLAHLGWQNFSEDEHNSLATALGFDGVCPPPGDENYVDGLNAGDTCLQLTLEDGGYNDADQQQNGVVSDPGGIAVLAAGASSSSAASSTSSSASSSQAASSSSSSAPKKKKKKGGALDSECVLMLLLLLALQMGNKHFTTQRCRHRSQ